MRRNPHLYQINTWPWLTELSRRFRRRVTLGSVPDEVWDGVRARGVDIIYLLGVWTRSATGRRIARSNPGAWASYTGATPGWHIPDVVGSAFCTSAYEPDPALGSMAELDRARAAMHARGMLLVVDFIPNHVGFDHPWTLTHPDRFIAGTEQDFRDDPKGFRLVELAGNEPRYVAKARDPYFPPWSDVAQLDYSKEDTRVAMVGELQKVAAHADGVRCDMAMLVLSDVFAGTWRKFVAPPTHDREFWEEARAAVPGLLLIAEVYWDLEWRLQELGFDFTYDKSLYDRLLHGNAASVAGHLSADPVFQSKSARFIENHDEPRSVEAFGARTQAMAVVVNTIPGMRFSYDGQFEGHRVRLPMQLGAEVEEPVNEPLAAFYHRLVQIVDDPIFHDGEWSMCPVLAVDDSSANILAWRWKAGSALRLVIVNLGAVCGEARVSFASELGPGERVSFEDLLADHRFDCGRGELEEHGVPVRLPAGGSHIFSVTVDDHPAR